MESSGEGTRWQLVAALVFVAVIGIVGWWSLRARHAPQPASQPAAAPARTSSSEAAPARWSPLTRHHVETIGGLTSWRS